MASFSFGLTCRVGDSAGPVDVVDRLVAASAGQLVDGAVGQLVVGAVDWPVVGVFDRPVADVVVLPAVAVAGQPVDDVADRPAFVAVQPDVAASAEPVVAFAAGRDARFLLSVAIRSLDSAPAVAMLIQHVREQLWLSLAAAFERSDWNFDSFAVGQPVDDVADRPAFVVAQPDVAASVEPVVAAADDFERFAQIVLDRVSLANRLVADLGRSDWHFPDGFRFGFASD